MQWDSPRTLRWLLEHLHLTKQITIFYHWSFFGLWMPGLILKNRWKKNHHEPWSLTMWQMLVRAVPPVCGTLEPWLFYHGAWLCFRTIFGTGKTASWTSLTVLGFRHLSLLLTLSYSFCLFDMCSSQPVSLHALAIGKQRAAVPSWDISPLPPPLANTLLTCPVSLFAHDCLLWTEVDYVVNYAIKARFWTSGQLFKPS